MGIKLTDLLEGEKPGLWANIRAKRASGRPMAKKGSKAYKTAKKAGDKINKEVDEDMYEEIDAVHENEEYCPKCMAKLKEDLAETFNKLSEKKR